MKTILVMAILVCLGSTVAFCNSNVNSEQTKAVLTQDELTFTEIAVEEVPKAVSEAFFKANEGAVIAKASKATTSAGKTVYKISVKDDKGEVVDYLYNEDGSEFGK